MSAYILSRLGFGSFSAEGLEQRVENKLDNQWHTALLNVHFFMWRMAWFRQDEVIAMHEWQENLDGARAMAKQKSWVAWSVKPERRWTSYDRWWHFLPGEVYDCNSLMQDAAQYETLREMTITAIALKRFQLRTGMFPANLSALVPEFLPELPPDWMDGKLLRYKLNADGTFTLYSVGENGVDDGGDPNSQQPTGSFQMWYALDAVWPVAATQEEIDAWEMKRLQRMRRTIESER
jgi:hypothetical protein